MYLVFGMMKHKFITKSHDFLKLLGHGRTGNAMVTAANGVQPIGLVELVQAIGNRFSAMQNQVARLVFIAVVMRRGSIRH